MILSETSLIILQFLQFWNIDINFESNVPQYCTQLDDKSWVPRPPYYYCGLTLSQND